MCVYLGRPPAHPELRSPTHAAHFGRCEFERVPWCSVLLTYRDSGLIIVEEGIDPPTLFTSPRPLFLFCNGQIAGEDWLSVLVLHLL